MTVPSSRQRLPFFAKKTSTVARLLRALLWQQAALTLTVACAAQPPTPRPRVASAPELPAFDPPAPAPAPLVTPTPAPAPAPAPPLPDGPVFNREVLLLRKQAQSRVLGAAPVIEDERGAIVPLSEIPVDDVGVPAWKNGNALGHFVPVENEAALEHFHEALERLATGRDEDGKLRILSYGASHTQGDLYTGYLRYYLQSRFGNGGPGFMQMARINPWYRKHDYRVFSKGFTTEHAQKKTAPEHGRFGLMGVAAIGRFPYAFARIEPANDQDFELTANRYELFYSAEPKGGDVNLSIDEDKPTRLPGRAQEAEPRYHVVELPGLGWHTLEAKPAGNGPIRIYGISAERSTPGIVIDTLGINGTRAANMLTWDEHVWGEHLKHRAPDLVTLAYGTNETVDTGQPIEHYEKDLRLVLESIRRALPATSCVLMGPGDFPRQGDDGWKTRARLIDVIDVQRRVAPDFDCGFWDTFAFMGGEDSMHEWVEAKPPLGAPDHIHFTARGYVKLGMAFGDALMRAYDAFHLQPDPPAP